jgi:hypothetical protein
VVSLRRGELIERTYPLFWILGNCLECAYEPGHDAVHCAAFEAVGTIAHSKLKTLGCVDGDAQWIVCGIIAILSPDLEVSL